MEAVRKAAEELERRKAEHTGELSLVPDEPYPDESASGALSSSVLFGPQFWGDIFTDRQMLTISVLVKTTRYAGKICDSENDILLSTAIKTSLALILDKVAVFGNALTRWGNDDQGITALFSRQALPMAWDFAESAPLRTESWGWSWALDWITEFYVSQPQFEEAIGEVVPASAAEILLPDDSVQAIVTDPPYYDAIAYGDLSNFFLRLAKKDSF